MTELKKEKERRGANFTKIEIDLLIDIVMKYKDIIENKRTDATTWKDKNDAWIQISEEFNAVSGSFARSHKTIKAKYESIKKNLRKKCATMRRELNKTGGGVPESSELNSFEEKVMSMTQFGMLGMSSRFDNDIKSNSTLHDVEIEYIEDNDVLAFLEVSGDTSENNGMQIPVNKAPITDKIDSTGNSYTTSTVESDISKIPAKSNYDYKTTNHTEEATIKPKGDFNEKPSSCNIEKSKFIHKQKNEKLINQKIIQN